MFRAFFSAHCGFETFASVRGGTWVLNASLLLFTFPFSFLRSLSSQLSNLPPTAPPNGRSLRSASPRPRRGHFRGPPSSAPRHPPRAMRASRGRGPAPSRPPNWALRGAILGIARAADRPTVSSPRVALSNAGFGLDKLSGGKILKFDIC